MSRFSGLALSLIPLKWFESSFEPIDVSRSIYFAGLGLQAELLTMPDDGLVRTREVNSVSVRTSRVESRSRQAPVEVAKPILRPAQLSKFTTR